MEKMEKRQIWGKKEERRQLSAGWKVTLACSGVTFLSGITYSWSIFAGGLSRELGWTQVQAAFPIRYLSFVMLF